MSEKLLPPKFLTTDVAAIAVNSVIHSLFSDRFLNAMGGILPHEDVGNCHVVILVPAIRPSDKWPHFSREPFELWSKSFGDSSKWKYPFQEIAQCKAQQLWYEANDGQGPTPAHLLFPLDTPYWGGVKREGIVVAVSGFAEHFDRMAAGMIAEICIALARNDYLESDEVKERLNFLT